MKLGKAKLFFCVLAVVQLVASPVRAIDRSYVEALKVDANGNTLPIGKYQEDHRSITFTNGVTVNTANLGLANKVYVSVRTDGPPCGTGATANICGSGTALDPYDGSTYTKLDAVLKANNTKDVTLNPGVFLTEGESGHLAAGHGWTPGSGMTLRGTGNRMSTLRLTPNVQTLYHWMIGKAPSADVNNKQSDVTIENLVIDFNENNQNFAQLPTYPGGWSQGVWLHGSRNTARNLYFINYASRYHDSEIFLCILGSPSGEDARDNLIEDCEIGVPAGGTWPGDNAGLTGFAVIGNANGATTHYSYGGKVRNCKVSGITIGDGTSGPAYLHFLGGPSWTFGSVYEGNTGTDLLGPYGFNVCIYMDTGPMTNAIFRNNVFTNVALGVFWNSPVSVQTGLRFENNQITIGQANGQGISMNGDSPSKNLNTIITGNVIKAYGSLDPLTAKGISAGHVTNVNASNNTIDVGTINVDGVDTRFVTTGDTTIGKADNNHQSDGTAIYPINASVGGFPYRYDYSANFGGLRSNGTTTLNVLEAGNTLVNNLSITQTAFGNGAGLQNVHVDAGNVNTPTREIDNANYTILTGTGDYMLENIRNLTTHTWTIPAANTCGGCVRIMKDSAGDVNNSTRKINLGYTTQIEGQDLSLDEPYESWTIKSNSTIWNILDHYVPPE